MVTWSRANRSDLHLKGSELIAASPMVEVGFVTVAVVVNAEHDRRGELGKNERKEIVCDRREQSLG